MNELSEQELNVFQEALQHDKLDQLFLKQQQLQAKLGNDHLIGNQPFITEMSIALIDEIMESLRETPWKSWKKNQTFNQDAFQKELVDAWHFLINLTLASGLTSKTLWEKFLGKNKENVDRKNRGY
jgi:dimeric dUTPase (all-alpha-NTP-PPase superfamily)